MRLLLLVITFLALFSCSTFHKIGIGASSGAIKTATVGMETQYDYSVFEEGTKGNLALIEGLLYITPENQNLLSSLIKGYSGLGFGVYETKYLDDQFNDRDNSIHKKMAIENYSKAIHFSKKFFKSNGADFNEYLKLANDNKKAADYLNSHFTTNDLTGIFFTAQAWASLINLQRENITLLAQLSPAKHLFDFVCSQKPNFAHGSCDVFYGAYYLGRPKTLGGDPEKGREILVKLIEKDKNNLLSKVNYLQFYAIAYENQDEFEKISSELEKDFQEFNRLKNYGDSLKGELRFKADSTLNLFNAIAQKRYEMMKKNKKEIF